MSKSVLFSGLLMNLVPVGNIADPFLSSAASTATYPLQVLKARLQQRSENLEITPEGEVRAVRREYHGVRKTIRRMWKREGVIGFFRGCIPNALRVAPGAAITFVVYETIIDMFVDDL